MPVGVRQHHLKEAIKASLLKEGAVDDVVRNNGALIG